MLEKGSRSTPNVKLFSGFGTNNSPKDKKENYHESYSKVEKLAANYKDQSSMITDQRSQSSGAAFESKLRAVEYISKEDPNVKTVIIIY